MTVHDAVVPTRIQEVRRELAPLVLDHLARMIRQPSISATGEGVVEMADLLVGVMEEFSLSAERNDTPGHPVVVGRRGDDPKLPTVLFYGHYDVQPPGDDGWSSDPFSPDLRRGRLYGRGSADSKGQLLAILAGLEVARRIEPSLPANVIVVADGEEEIGSPNLLDFVRRHRARLRADAGYMADGSIHPSGAPIIALGSRGLLCVELTVEDDRGPLHSGNFGGVVPSPVWRLVTALEAIRTRQIVAVGARRPTATTVEQLSLLPPPGLPAGADPSVGPKDHWRIVCTQPCLNISGIRGGYVGDGFQTAIPSKATVRLDARLVPGQHPSDVFSALEECLRSLPFPIRVRSLAQTPPTQLASDHPWPSRVGTHLREVYGLDPHVLPVLPGTVPLSAFVDELGVPMIVVPHGNADQNNHAPDENLLLECLDRGIDTVAGLLLSPWEAAAPA